MNAPQDQPDGHLVTVTLYWNHICILHNFEKAYLERVRQRLLGEGINLVVRFFGLGYHEHMATYLARDDAHMPDLIVSADLEVFECAPIFNALGPLYDCASWLPLKSSACVQAVRRTDQLLPIVAIPLVLYATSPVPNEPLPTLARNAHMAFGGINNSAGKIVVKSVWERYGKSAAEELLDRCAVTPMPIEAFQAARTRKTDFALVPSLYALRADGVDSFCAAPHEGPMLLPSYLCARTSIDKTVAQRVCHAVLSEELLDFYATNGDLIVCPQQSQEHASTQASARSCFTASQPFLSKLDYREFYNLYCRFIPSAETLCCIST